MEELRGRTAVITGAGSGIGAALARACGRAGMQVVAADIELDAAETVVASLQANGTRALAVRVDVADRRSVQALADITRDSFGGCQLLCNNAGVSVLGKLAQASLDDWHWVLSVNLLGVAHGLAAFLPGMLASGQPAHIVNTASMAGLVPLPDFGVYCASKYAVVGLSEVLHAELASAGIGVSIVCPGLVATRIQHSERNRPGFTTADTAEPDAAASGAAASAGQTPTLPAPLARLIEPEEVAERVLRAVRTNTLYVPTHADSAPLFTERSAAITHAFAHCDDE